MKTRIIYFIYNFFYEPIFNFIYLIKWKIYGKKLFKKDGKNHQIMYVSLIHGGGLARHVSDLTEGLKTNYAIWIIRKNRWIYHINGSNRSIFRYPETMTLSEVISEINPSVIHIHQLSETLWEIPHIPLDKCVITLHDVYYVCPHYFMTECLGTRFCHPSLCSKEWREQMHSILQQCKCIIAPSTAIKEIILFYYPDIEEKIIIIEHGI
jgi:glycosyltransferase involved in cell wall biosynthesis